MSRFTQLLRTVLWLPFKVGLWIFLVGLGVAIGTNGPWMWEMGHKALARFNFTIDSAFDPSLQSSPEQELSLIHNVRDKVAPQLKRAQVLLRGQQAELQWLREKASFIEDQVPRSVGETRSAQEILQDLAASVEDSENAAPEDLALFEQLGGPAWLALRQKSESLEESLRDLLTINERIGKLSHALESERRELLQIVPGDAAVVSARATSHDLVSVPEIDESRRLLDKVHETLFKTVYSIDPSAIGRDKDKIQLTSIH